MSNIKIPKTARGQETLEKIYEAAILAFEKKGYYETSVSEIASLANIAIGTFYIYFKDKTTLYEYVLGRYSHEIRQVSALAARQHTTRIDKEFYGLKAYLQYVIDHPGAYRIIWESQYVCPDYFKAYYEDFSSRYVKELTVARDNNEIIDCDLVDASYFLIGVYTMFGLKKCIFDQTKEIRDDDIKTIMQLVKKGLFI